MKAWFSVCVLAAAMSVSPKASAKKFCPYQWAKTTNRFVASISGQNNFRAELMKQFTRTPVAPAANVKKLK
jgi:hypothetical protein